MQINTKENKFYATRTHIHNYTVFHLHSTLCHIVSATCHALTHTMQ